MGEEENEAVAQERKRKRLEAWRKRQEEKAKQESIEPTKPKVILSLGAVKNLKKKKSTTHTLTAFEKDADESIEETKTSSIQMLHFDASKEMNSFDDSKKRRRWEEEATEKVHEEDNTIVKKKSRWNILEKTETTKTSNETSKEQQDDLDKFMLELTSGVMGQVVLPDKGGVIDVSGSMFRQQQYMTSNTNDSTALVSGSVITPEELANLMATSKASKSNKEHNNNIYGPSDWETSASETETDDEEEENARRQFLETLHKASVGILEEVAPRPAQLAAEVQSEKHRREKRLQELKQQVQNAQKESEKAAQPEIGRIYYEDVESGVMEEAERRLNAINAAPVDALEVLAELNKKKELKAVDHSKIDYIPIRKNLYIVPRSVASLTEEQIIERKAKWKIRVRGKGAPAPVDSFEECGLSERILSILHKMNIEKPYAIQAMCLPCIMAGRDVIGIAKTGSGKTLAYLLPMLRHISDQPPLGPGESGPIGLVLAPARELAVQIHSVCKVFAKHLGLNSTAVYGGAGVAEQIGDLKRGTHIAVATPGRMIDILTMQSGRVLSLKRVSYVVMDEADRMFDMGFAPQISAILAAIRPDRQTVLFSATFPKVVENLARQSLKYPIEVLVGGRSVASDSVEQHGEVLEEDEKFLRLLQLLGEYADDKRKVIVFVDTQLRADSIFEQLIRCGYPSLSLHGGKEQEDRDSTISDFKRADGPNVLVATSVAGRGLDVPSCGCVINYSAPNHLEDYVHRVGRTGRASNKGVSFTFVNSGDEEKFAPVVVRAMIEAGQGHNISEELRKLSDDFKKKVERGEARYAGSGFHGRGFTYDASELSESQKVARAEKRQALIDAGLLDPDDEEFRPEDEANDQDNIVEDLVSSSAVDVAHDRTKPGGINKVGALSAELLALPGMKEAIMKKAGFEVPTAASGAATGEHFLEEIEINDYPREARWKVTQKETTSRLQDEFQIAVTLKGQFYDSKSEVPEGERKLYLHVEATSQRILQTGVQEIRRLLNEETLRVGAKTVGGRYSVL